MKSDPLSLLEAAVDVVRKTGQTCGGWTLQSDGGGYVAWLYREDEGGQWPLFDEVDASDTPLGAAQYCLDRARQL